MRSFARWILCGFLLAGCGGDSAVGGGHGFGATVGGVKDMRYARDLISKGVIPPADAILVEAMFSEHDLALDGPTCDRTLCLRAAAGFAPELDGTPRGFAQVGLSSGVDPDAWERPATTFIFTADTSGSMHWGDAGETPGELSRGLMHLLTDQLRDDDRVAIITYGDTVHTVLAPTSGSQKSVVHTAISHLQTEGVTDMESGMKAAYALGALQTDVTPNVRVIVFTDTQPNVGATSASSFNTLVAGAANSGVYTTVLGLGVGMKPDVYRAMASLRGANAFSMAAKTEIADWFTDEWPWFTTPIAFDLRVNAALGTGWSIDRGLGFPAASDAEQIGLKASSVFLSKRRGALLVALNSPDGTPATLDGSFSMLYTEPDGTPVTATTPFAYGGAALDARGQWFAQHGVARTTALALLTEGMHDAAAEYATSSASATEMLRAAHERFVGDAAALGDSDLDAEIDLSAALLSLMENHAEQGTLYGITD